MKYLNSKVIGFQFKKKKQETNNKMKWFTEKVNLWMLQEKKKEMSTRS